MLAVVAGCSSGSGSDTSQVLKGGPAAPPVNIGGSTPTNAPMVPTPRRVNTVANVPAPPDHKTETIIAFGDSYGSGEGNPLKAIDPNWFSSNMWDIVTGVVTTLGVTAILKLIALEVIPALIRLALLTKGTMKIADPYFMFPQGHATWSNAPAGSAQERDDTRCHRSDQSGIAKAAATRAKAIGATNVVLKSFACSGAISDNISNSSDVNRLPHAVGYDGVEDGVLDGLPLLKSQIDQSIDWLKSTNRAPESVDAVYVSIGGNDAKFADVISACFVMNMPFLRTLGSAWDKIKQFFGGTVVPSDCTDSSGFQTGLGAIGQIPTRISNLAQDIRAVYPNAVIMFSGYPDPISVGSGDPGDVNRDGLCSVEDLKPGARNPNDAMWNLTAAESRKIRDNFLTPLNSAIETGTKNATLPPKAGSSTPPVKDTKVVYLGDHTKTATAGFHGFCSRQPGIQFNTDAMKSQMCFGGPLCLLSIGISPGAWHPNDLGYTLYGQSISSMLTRVDNWEFEDTSPPKPPEFIQATSVTSDGYYTLNWSDASNNEDFYEFTAAPLNTNGSTGTRTTPVRVTTGTQQYTYSAPNGRGTAFRFAVRACNTRNKTKTTQCSADVTVDVGNLVPNPAAAPAEVTNCNLSFELSASSCEASSTLPPGLISTSSNYLVVSTKVNNFRVKNAVVPVSEINRLGLTFDWKDDNGTLLAGDSTATATVTVQYCSIVDGGKCSNPSPVHSMTGRLSLPATTRPTIGGPTPNFTVPSIPQVGGNLTTPSIPVGPSVPSVPSIPSQGGSGNPAFGGR